MLHGQSTAWIENAQENGGAVFYGLLSYTKQCDPVGCKGGLYTEKRDLCLCCNVWYTCPICPPG